MAALQLSAQKWGESWIRSDAQFQRICVELAAEHRFTITNRELQQAITAERERLRIVRTPETPTRRPESVTPAAIYGRHLAAVVQEPSERKADAWRLYAEIAVRLAVSPPSVIEI